MLSESRICNDCQSWQLLLSAADVPVITNITNALPISYLIDARPLIFWQKIRRCDNVVVMTLSSLKYNYFIATGAKHISSYDVSIKNAVWCSFASSVMICTVI